MAPGSRLRHRTVARPAPAFTPMMFGLASGLPITDCRITPDSASPTPAISPASIRGSRSDSRITRSVS